MDVERNVPAIRSATSGPLLFCFQSIGEALFHAYCSRAEQMEAERNAAAAHAAAASLQGVSLPPAADFSADRPYVPPASEPAWQTEGAGGAWYSGDGGQQDAGSSGGSGRGRAEAGSRAETGSGSQQSWEQQPKWRWGERQLGWDQQDRRDGGGGGRFGGRCVMFEHAARSPQHRLV